MKKYFSILHLVVLLALSLIAVSCVHDNKYDEPELANYQCADLTANMTLKQALALQQNVIITGDYIVEGYVSSSDETGNIYKTIFIQDKPSNPTMGMTLSVDAVSTYTNYPQGAKIYVNLKGLAIGTYGGLKQVGMMVNNVFGRIPQAMVPNHIKRSCTIREKIVPKTMKLNELGTNNDDLLGCLIQVENAEFDAKVLCASFAPDGESVDRQLNDPTASLTTRVVRNSGFASFASQMLPAGKGTFIGVLSKFNSTYQFYINRVSDIQNMYADNAYPRKDGIASNPCKFDPTSLTQKTVAEVKQLLTTTTYNQITGNYYVKGQVTANDFTGNLYKYLYIEDATGGIRININKVDLFLDNRFVVGKQLIVKLKDLYIGNVNGEKQLGVPFNNSIGQIAEADIYKYFFDSNSPITTVVPKEMSITQLNQNDVGRMIRIKDVQFIDADLGKTYASGTTSNRTLTDCAGNKVLLRTSNFASFATKEIDGGKGIVTAILSYFAPDNVYQLWIPAQANADLDNARCDGSNPPHTIFKEEFASTLDPAKWTAVSVTGTKVWSTSNAGTGTNYYAVLNGFGENNEDWLISAPISLSGLSTASLSFDTDGRYDGAPLKVYITDNYSGNPATTTWTELPAALDTNLAAWSSWTNSGQLNLGNWLNKSVRIAFKYTSTTTAATTWELDNVRVNGK